MIQDELRRVIKGQVWSDQASIAKASRDASIFEVKPEVVVSPKDVKDLQALVQYATHKNLFGERVTLSARNAGTCMSGGSLNESIIVDMSTHFNHIGAVDTKHRRLKIQGGVMHLEVEKVTHPHRLLFAPYTSSRDICGVGGMIGNNASGEKSVKYGPTSSNVDTLKVLLSDGEVYEFGPLTLKQLAIKKELPTFEGKIYREITQIIDDNWHLIDHGHPKVKKNAAGYALWDLWDEHRQTFNLGRLFIGAQGTLGFVTEAELKLVPFSNASRMIVVPISKLSDLTNVVKTMLLANPVTCETFDVHTYELAKKYYPVEAARASAAEGQHMIVFGIYDGDHQAQADTQAGKAKLALEALGYPVTWVNEQDDVESYLLIRRKSFKMLLDHPPAKTRAMPFIEDTIVSIEHYGEFLASLEAILLDYDMIYTYAGHIGDGSIRLVPLVDMEKPGAAEQIIELAQKVYELVFAFGGSMGVDHNDGLIKTPFLELMYGHEINALFAKTKHLFDPLNIFNPGKKVGSTIQYALDHMIKENTN